MGDSIKALYDDYDTYLGICEKLNRHPVPMRGSEYFIDDQKKILSEYGCRNPEDLFELINCVQYIEEDFVPLKKKR